MDNDLIDLMNEYVQDKTSERIDPKPLAGYELLEVPFDYLKLSNDEIEKKMQESFKNGVQWAMYLVNGFLKTNGGNNV